MREHGVLNRVLLIYEAGLVKFGRGESFDVLVLSRAANIVREFIEGYHERNEEQQLFPVSVRLVRWLSSSTCFTSSIRLVGVSPIQF